MSLSEASARLFELIDKTIADGHEPLVVFDLDGTLYDNTHRTLRILQEFAHMHARRLPELVERVDGMAARDQAYKVADTLKKIGVDGEDLVEEITQFWLERFFTDEYVTYDLPTPGARELVVAVHERGGVPVYLTGRDAPNMLQGTVHSLQRDGFPVGRVDTRAILKEDFDRPDDEYKEAVISHLRRVGHVVGAFDNEPGLCNLFKANFPDAVVVWLDTSHAPGAPDLRDDVPATKNFLPML